MYKSLSLLEQVSAKKLTGGRKFETLRVFLRLSVHNRGQLSLY